ncbi:hypothetical protein C9J19_07865 [Photobacterium phosphoreum]|uniref:response regulator n=1 Tax=Photobacterium phosphoreum TaxID=659 RepID=UPI000D179FC1|nr:response regulator [Photobacterium phosphoreum]PSW29219.1 hypothetical protein C9J19_07865 [Photobacterium phosphoreum]
MTTNFIVTNEYLKFLFDNNHLNIFNLVRLFKNNTGSDEIALDIRHIPNLYQEAIAVNFISFLNIYKKLIPTQQQSASLFYSGIEPYILDKLDKKDGVLLEDGFILFELENLSPQKDKKQDPHVIKNIRGAVLLSLVQDLLELGSIGNNIPIFDKKSPLLLHSASSFLNNEDNALMMWKVLESWEVEYEHQYKAEINRRIQKSLQEKRALGLLINKQVQQSFERKQLLNFIVQLQSNIDIPSKIYITIDNLHIWFIDDQQANGWFKLIESMVPNSKIEITPFSGVEDVTEYLKLYSINTAIDIPDLAMVDLRLSDSDQVVESYKSQDLSGFKVVDLLRKQWPGLPIMISSASSKLWNMEKAIERGAVAYWRKSDEVSDYEGENAILTAFDINFQYIDKLTLTLKMAEYKYVFRIVECLRVIVKTLVIKSDSLQRCIENYANELEQKTTWMCWQKTSEIKVKDSLFLGIMEIFNEIESILWDRNNNSLILVPDKKVKSSGSLDKQIINDTLDYMDRKYEINGVALKERYEKCKNIRNKLPIIHGSEGANDIQHATLIDIETSLLIIWCVLNELKLKK